ncbi:tandem-95 repeat protein [Methylomicrobium lacus]|uniref:tandem-95 repeat protein n=1 Tax=Methylomicrobium lacus TaxID=136992 RepID=UPI0035A84378
MTAAQLLAGASDVDGDALHTTTLSLSDPAQGQLTANADGSWTFVPAANLNGNVAFDYTVSDGELSASSRASLTLDPVNDAPIVVAPLALQAVQIDSPNWSYHTAAAFSDADLSDVLSFSAKLANDDPLPTWMHLDAETGVITGIPKQAHRGHYALVITATDAAGASISAPLTVAATLFDAGRLLFSTPGNDELTGDAGNDTVTYEDAAQAVTVSLESDFQRNTGGHGRDSLVAIDNLIGSNFNDKLTGNSGNNTLDGGSGVDKLKGGDGDDTYIIDNSGDKVTETGNGGNNDTVQSWATLAKALANNVENIELMGTEDLNAIGNTLDNHLIGNAGNNRLDGKKGADLMAGGAGDDTYVVDNIGDVISENNEDAGIDKVESSIDYKLAANVENLLLIGSGRSGTGNDLDNTLTGNKGNNILTGLAGDDKLFGDAGKDILIGGLGVDELSGGKKADTFVFESLADSGVGADRDTIMDFIASQKDLIDLSGIDAKAGTIGNDAFSWIANAEFGKVEGELRYFQENGNAIVEGDVNGDGSADFQIELSGIASLQDSNFVL